MRQFISFLVDPDLDKNEKSGWTLSITREGESVLLGLHWQEKAYPTHLFKLSFDEFREIAAKLEITP